MGMAAPGSVTVSLEGPGSQAGVDQGLPGGPGLQGEVSLLSQGVPAPPRPREPPHPRQGHLLTSPSGPQASGSPQRRSSSRSHCTAAPASPSSSRSSPQTGPGSRWPGPLRGRRVEAGRPIRALPSAARFPHIPLNLSQTPPVRPAHLTTHLAPNNKDANQ